MSKHRRSPTDILRCDVSACVGHAWNLLLLSDEHLTPDDERPATRGIRALSPRR